MDNTVFLTDKEIIDFETRTLLTCGIVLDFGEAREQATKLAMAFDLMLENLDIIDNDKN